MSKPSDVDAVLSYLRELQDRLTRALESADGAATFREDAWERPTGGGGLVGGGHSRVMRDGALFEQAGINFSHVTGARLPPAVTAQRPELAGRGFEAMGVSLVVHPRNPTYPPPTPTSLLSPPRGRCRPGMVVRRRLRSHPCYGFEEDCVHWHRTARAACEPFGPEVHPRFKRWCDDYFFIKHRNEPRGIGGLFFDDLNDWGFERCFAFLRSVGDHYLPAYLPIVERRREMRYGERAGVPAFTGAGAMSNSIWWYDRGTLFGLQSGGRTESILMSLPPRVRWEYDWRPEPDSPEARLSTFFLQPRDWLWRHLRGSVSGRFRRGRSRASSASTCSAQSGILLDCLP